MSAAVDFGAMPAWEYPLAGLSDDDQQLRRGRITASVASMICGESEFGGPLRAYRIIRGIEPYRPNRSKDLGRIYEPVAGAFHQLRHPSVRLVHPGTRVHPEVPWLAASVDWIALGEYGLYVFEAKYTDERNKALWGSQDTAEIPAGYRIQCSLQMAVWGLSRALFGVLIGGTDYREYRVERDLDFERDTLAVLERFRMEYLLPRIPPPDDDRRVYTQTIYPAPVADIRDASDEPETIACAADVERLAGERSRLEADYQKACGELCEQIGPNEGVQIGKEKITWKRRKNASERVLSLPRSWHNPKETADVNAAAE